VFGTMGLSYISSRMKDQEAVPDDYVALVFFWGFLATSYTLFVAVTLDWLTPLIFGRNFSVGLFMHLMMMVMAFCGVAKGAPTILLLASGKTGKLALLNLSAGLGLIIAFVLIHWWPRFEVVLLGMAVGTLLSYALFFIGSSTWLVSRRSAILIDTGTALAVLSAIIVTFGVSPELTFESRGIVLGVGSLAITMQVAFGLRLHETLISGLFRSRGY
jgi:O-antigen/teichoic acid export membrane protein